ncbi:MAG: hypothetical protein ACREX5_14490 [Achromobacter pestifer]
MTLKNIADSHSPLAFDSEYADWNSPSSPSTASGLSSVELMRHALVKLKDSPAHHTPERIAAMQYLASAISMASIVTCS